MSKAYDRGRDMARLGLDYDAKYPDQAQPLEQKVACVEKNEVGAPRKFQRGYRDELRSEQQKRAR
jgi:hypothetical protein